MAYWTFFDFVDEQGQNTVREWVDGLDVSVRRVVKANLNVRLRYLENCLTLEMPYARPLTLHAGIFEIRLKVDKVQYRPLCCYGPGRQEITMLVGAIEKDRKLLPSSAGPTAEARRKLILQGGRKYVREHDFS